MTTSIQKYQATPVSRLTFIPPAPLALGLMVTANLHGRGFLLLIGHHQSFRSIPDSDTFGHAQEQASSPHS